MTSLVLWDRASCYINTPVFLGAIWIVSGSSGDSGKLSIKKISLS